MDASRYLAVTRRWGWLLVLGAVFSLATYGVAMRLFPDDEAPVRFEASALVLVAADQDGTSTTTDNTQYALTSTYAEMIGGRAVAERLAALFGTPEETAAIRAQISSEVIPSTQLVRVVASGAHPEEATTLAQSAASAFIAMHDERGMPGSVFLSDTEAAALVAPPNDSLMLDVLIVLLGGFLAAGAIVLAFECLTDRIRAGEDAASAVGLSVLGTIPRWNAMSLALSTDGDRGEDAEEAYRDLRTSIALSTLHDIPSTLLFTGPGVGAGASTTAANYAAALAQAGRSVALVDADMRVPSLHRMFGLEDGNGLAQALMSETDVDSFMQTTGIDGLALLSAGGPQANAPELIASSRFGDVLVALEERYDVVIIDAPPALVVTDATLVAAQCDATIIVVRADESTRTEAAAAVMAMRRASRMMLGVVLNAEPSGALAFRRGLRPLVRGRKRASAMR